MNNGYQHANFVAGDSSHSTHSYNYMCNYSLLVSPATFIDYEQMDIVFIITKLQQ